MATVKIKITTKDDEVLNWFLVSDLYGDSRDDLIRLSSYLTDMIHIKGNIRKPMTPKDFAL